MRAILHIDGDAFFASCEQSLNPDLKGKPVVTGKERGIAASMSYEAKARGVTRAMPLWQIKKLIPEVVILPSDYETYSLLSKKFFNIVRRYTPDVEEYGIDECFADITGLRRPLHMSYAKIAETIRGDLERELGFTFSIGLASTKVLAKLASKWKKPDGLTIISSGYTHSYLERTPIEKVWGIGPQTSAFLNKEGIRTALEFVKKDETWVKSKLTKPHIEIWQELNGTSVYQINPETKTSYQSISKTRTFTPPSSDKAFVFSQLSNNIENACIKARRYNLASLKFFFFLKTQDFRYHGMELKLSQRTAVPSDIINLSRKLFESVYKNNCLYRATGIILADLAEDNFVQADLFGQVIRIESMRNIYKSIDSLDHKYGKHTVYLGSSFNAQKFSRHLGERGDEPERKRTLLKGETKRKHLNIPRFSGEVI